MLCRQNCATTGAVRSSGLAHRELDIGKSKYTWLDVTWSLMSSVGGMPTCAVDALGSEPLQYLENGMRSPRRGAVLNLVDLVVVPQGTNNNRSRTFSPS